MQPEFSARLSLVLDDSVAHRLVNHQQRRIHGRRIRRGTYADRLQPSGNVTDSMKQNLKTAAENKALEAAEREAEKTPAEEEAEKTAQQRAGLARAQVRNASALQRVRLALVSGGGGR